MADEIVIAFTPTARDYSQTRAYMNRHLLGRWRWGHLAVAPLLASLIGGGLLILAALGDLYAPPHRVLFTLYGLLTILFGMFAVLLYVMALRRWISGRIFYPGGYLLESRRFTFTPQGLSNDGSIAHTTVAWAKTYGLLDDKDYIYFLLDRGFAFFLPKRCFEKPEAAEAFLKTITEWREKAVKGPAGTGKE